MKGEKSGSSNQPFIPVAFPSCLPRPYPGFMGGVRFQDSNVGEGFSDWMKEDETRGRKSLMDGRTPFDSERQARMDLFSFADSRKTSPRSMLRHPIAKRKNAATRVKSST